MSEIAPQRANHIFLRGRAFAESRLVCNVHWQSDVLAGRFLGAGIVARLHADPRFREDLVAATAEIAAARAANLQPDRDCAAEAAAPAPGGEAAVEPAAAGGRPENPPAETVPPDPAPAASEAASPSPSAPRVDPGPGGGPGSVEGAP